MTDTTPPDLTPEAYLRWEPTQAKRYEYINSKPIARSPQTTTQTTIVHNFTTALKTRMQGHPCRLSLDKKVQAQQSFYYADVMVSCEISDRLASQVIQAPCLVVEVQSAQLWGDRFLNYQQIVTLQEYVCLDPETIAVHCFRRNTFNGWDRYSFGVGDRLYLDTMSFLCPVSILYENVSIVRQ
jgi:Uma2 family endonuclease